MAKKKFLKITYKNLKKSLKMRIYIQIEIQIPENCKLTFHVFRSRYLKQLKTYHKNIIVHNKNI